jgi:hypothetical protein
MEKVKSSKLSEAEKQSVVKKNNTFFDAYMNYKRNLQCYFIVRDKLGFVIDEKVMDKVIELNISIKSIFDQRIVIKPDKIKSDMENICNRLEEQWQIFIIEKNKKILADLSVLLQVSDNKSLIKNLQTDIKKCNSWPVEVTTLETYLSECKHAEEVLREVHFDEEIEKFLKKVSEKTATLKDLTPSVLKWISDEGFVDKIALSIKI